MRLLLCLLAAGLALLGRPLQATIAATLTTLDVDDAIRLGKVGNPLPYPIYNPRGERPREPLVMAVVYTPFIRVALAAKAARLDGRDFAPENVTADLAQPVVYIAYRWYCCVDNEHGESKATWNPHRGAADYRIAANSDRNVLASSMSLLPPPLSVTHDVSAISRFGEPLPYDDFVLVAAYPITELAHARDFAIYRNVVFEGHAGVSTIPGRVTPGDLASWR